MKPIPDEFWIIVTQYDGSPNGFSFCGPPKGPLVHEGYCLTQEEAEERARRLAGGYGWSTILKVKTEGAYQ
jgi:hypothetical protein